MKKFNQAMYHPTASTKNSAGQAAMRMIFLARKIIRIAACPAEFFVKL